MVKRLTTLAGNDNRPSYSADGRRIVFRSERDGDPEIYVMNADGSDQTRLTTSTGTDSRPAPGPLPSARDETPERVHGSDARLRVGVTEVLSV